jgi:hypothetical protein
MVSQRFCSSFRLVAWLAAAAVCIACAKDSPTAPSNPGTKVLGVTVSPSFVMMDVGDRLQLVGLVTAESGVKDRGVTWSSSNSTIASVNVDGAVTAHKSGTVTVRAISNVDPSSQGAAAVTVRAADLPTTPPVIVIEPIPPTPPPSAPPDPPGQKYLGTFGVTANQIAPANSCFLSTYQGELTLAAVGALPTGGLGVDFVITYGTSTRRYAGSVDADGGFIGSGIGPAGGTALLSGRVAVSPSGAATIVFDEQFTCPSNGGATFRGAGERK